MELPHTSSGGGAAALQRALSLVKLWRALHAAFARENMRANFASCDQNSYGHAKLEHIISRLPAETLKSMSESDRRSIMGMLDTDGDGYISYEEFYNFFSQDETQPREVPASQKPEQAHGVGRRGGGSSTLGTGLIVLVVLVVLAVAGLAVAAATVSLKVGAFNHTHHTVSQLRLSCRRCCLRRLLGFPGGSCLITFDLPRGFLSDGVRRRERCGRRSDGRRVLGDSIAHRPEPGHVKQVAIVTPRRYPRPQQQQQGEQPHCSNGIIYRYIETRETTGSQ